jgi:translation initiation factor 2 gamma subunit (eIF-2gamma)
VNQYDIVPKFIDYYLEVPTNNNGHEPPVLLARRTFANTPGAPFDSFNGTVCASKYKIQY